MTFKMLDLKTLHTRRFNNFHVTFMMTIKNKKIRDAAVFGCLIAALLTKLFIVSQSEIYLSSGDNLTYVFYADHWYWRSPFLPDRPPLTSLWMALSTEIGLRFRLLQELLFLLASTTMSLAVLKFSENKILAISCFVLTIFAPIANYHLDFAMADGLYMSLNLLLTSLLIFMVGTSKFQVLPAVLAGLTASAMILTRVEYEIVILTILTALVIIFYNHRNHFKQGVALVITYSCLISTPIVLSVAVVTHWSDNIWGYPGIPNYMSKGENSVMKQLMRIDAGHNGKYLPITATARDHAFAVSPTFKKYRELIEDPFVINLSESYTGVPNSLDTQRYIPLLKRVFRSEAYPGLFTKSDDDTDMKKTEILRQLELDRISKELQIGLDSGQIPSRFSPIPLIDPVISEWIKLVPNSLMKLTKLLFASPRPWIDMQGYGLLNRESKRMTRVLNRDPSLTQKGPMKGYVKLKSDRDIEKIELYVNALIYPMFAKFDTYPAEKLSQAIMTQKSKKEYSFEFPIVGERWVPVTLAFHISYKDGISENISSLEVGEEVIIQESASENISSYHITTFEPLISSTQSYSYKILIFLSDIYPAVIFIMLIILILYFIAYRVKLHRTADQVSSSDSEILMSLILFLIVVFGARIALLCLVDVAAWHVDIRYLAPVFPIFISLCFLMFTYVYQKNNELKLRDNN